MQSTHVLSSGSPSSSHDAFVAGASGVASLDTLQSSQTKAEIRNIVAEIAKLSASPFSQSEFLSGVLPLICKAMGANSAALWHCYDHQRCELLGHYRLPDLIHPSLGEVSTDETLSAEHSSVPQSRDACQQHFRILQCVVAEGSAVLVPPKSIRMATERPANPLEECLLIVPIKIDDRFEMMLEVIQPASGGPAAQRGYLRFVAQMADLMSDFLRRERLRNYAQRAQFVERLQVSLLTLSSTADKRERYQVVASALADLLDAELVLLAVRPSRLSWRQSWRVNAISHVPVFDARSEIVLAAERLLALKPRRDEPVPQFTIVDTEEFSQDDEREPAKQAYSAAHPAAQLRQQMNSHHVVQLAMGEGAACRALLAFDGSCDLNMVGQRARELAGAFETLLGIGHSTGVLSRPGACQDSPAQGARWVTRAVMQGWILRATSVLLVLAIALFPMPDNIGTLAVLESADKELYYAPASAIVDKVYVDTHQLVKKGQSLVQLIDDSLQARFEELQGQKASTSSQLHYDREELKRGGQSPGQAIALYGRIDQLEINLKAIEQQLAILGTQMDQLSIKARRDATVTTWDVKNQLSGRPVGAGQLLMATYQPNAPWQLRLSIPERQLGRLRAAMSGAREGLPVQFSLSSHPSEVRLGRLVKLSDQLVKDAEGVGHAVGIVAVDGNSLPTKTDGAVARATIACGRTYAGWLAVRDAYREASAWWRLNW